MSHAVLLEHRANATASSRVKPPSTQSVAEMRTEIGRSAGQTARTASKTSSGKRSAVLERAAVRSVRRFVSGREEAREQVAVRHVQLEQVEAASTARSRRATYCARTVVEVRRGPSPAAPGDTGEVRERRGREQRPVAVLERQVDALPHQLRRALAARVAELDADLRASEFAWTKSTMRFHGGDLPLLPQARAAGRDAPAGRDAEHLGHHQPGAAERARAEVHEVEVVDVAVDGRVHVHRRDDDAVLRAGARGAGTA